MQAEIVGGAMIGTAAGCMWLLNGRIAGITGVISSCFDWIRKGEARRLWAVWFLAGLVSIAPVAHWLGWQPQPIEMTDNAVFIMLAGLLAGIGTWIGNGCTSGHGVCGIGRLSWRSIVATGVFMTTGVVTVWVMERVI